MARTISVGLDGSPESRAAAEWAAREAELRAGALRIVHVAEAPPRLIARNPLLDLEGWLHQTDRMAREAAEDIRRRHPGIEVTTEHLTGTVADGLCEAAGAAELLVLGSRGLGGLGGFLAGSVSLAVVARAEHPVVLVRAAEHPGGGPDPASGPGAPRPVVLGVDIDEPADALLEFAFRMAVRRTAPLKAVHAWPEPPPSVTGFRGDAERDDSLHRGQAALLTKTLRPWRRRFPDVEVTEASRRGSAAQILVHESHGASLVVVGRRVRTASVGAHLGHVTHAALHHVAAPVAVVAHG
ncbi:universal stress protein [Streptomyces misionensis]